MYTINTITHVKCFVRYLPTRCFCIRNLTRSLRSLVRFLIQKELVRKYRTPALSLKYMKSLTFFSLGAAHASQVYTKTVNSGFFSALLALYKPRQRPLTVDNFILIHILILSFTITRFLNFKQNIFHTFYS